MKPECRLFDLHLIILPEGYANIFLVARTDLLMNNWVECGFVTLIYHIRLYFADGNGSNYCFFHFE